MPELIRALANRLRERIGNRRRAIRYETNLAAAISLHKAKATSLNAANKQSATIEGRLQDISATGLALIVNAIRIGDHYLTSQDHTLEIELVLPDGQTLIARAVPVRYEQLGGEGEKGYLIGARIVDTSDPKLFEAYLQTLST